MTPRLLYSVDEPRLSVVARIDMQRESCVLCLEGELCTYSVMKIGRQLEEWLEHSPISELRIDLTGVEFIDARGVALLLELYRTAEHQQCLVTVGPVSNCVARLIEICDLTFLTPAGETSGGDARPSAEPPFTRVALPQS